MGTRLWASNWATSWFGVWCAAYLDQPWLLAPITAWGVVTTVWGWRLSAVPRGSQYTGKARVGPWTVVLFTWVIFSVVLLIPFLGNVLRTTYHGRFSTESIAPLDFGPGLPWLVEWTHHVALTNCAVIPVLVLVRSIISNVPPRQRPA